MYEILIVGGGPAGLTAAIYAARAGKQLSLFWSGNARRTDRLRAAGRKLSGHSFGFRHRTCPEDDRTGVIRRGDPLYRGNRGFPRRKTASGSSAWTAPGRQKRSSLQPAHRTGQLGLSAEDALTGCGISYCAVCDGAFYDGADVAVVGGGDTALQDALFLANTCRSVTLIHRRDAFRASAQLVRRAQAQENIRILRSCTVQKLLLSDDSLQGAELLTNQRKTGETERIYVEGLFIAVGQMPAERAFSGCHCNRRRILSGRRGYQNQPAGRSLQPATDAKSRCVSSQPPSQTAQPPRLPPAAGSMPGKVNPDNSSHGTAKLPTYVGSFFALFKVFRGIFA